MPIQGVPNLGPGLRLHLNENTGGCSPKVVAAVRAFDATALALYPDFTDAVNETAAFLGVDPDRLVLTNGLDEGILLASIAFLGQRTPDALVELGASATTLSGAAEVIVAKWPPAACAAEIALKIAAFGPIYAANPPQHRARGGAARVKPAAPENEP